MTAGYRVLECVPCTGPGIVFPLFGLIFPKISGSLDLGVSSSMDRYLLYKGTLFAGRRERRRKREAVRADLPCKSGRNVHDPAKEWFMTAQVLFWQVQEAKPRPRWCGAPRSAKKKRERKEVL